MTSVELKYLKLFVVFAHGSLVVHLLLIIVINFKFKVHWIISILTIRARERLSKYY